MVAPKQHRHYQYHFLRFAPTSMRQVIVALLSICTIFTGICLVILKIEDGCVVSFGKYHGHKYQSSGVTIGNGKCLVESKWMQVMQHTVRPDGKEDEQAIINDWLFIDYHDRINVLVEDTTGKGDEKRFFIFRQSKYALEGRQSLAVIGGIIEPREDAETAAKREVEEELNGITCNNYHFLGRFRTDVNRGMGWVNSFLATDCKKSNNNNEQQQQTQLLFEEVGTADSERQDILSMTLSEVRDSARKGLFLEVQWSNTVALALLHESIMS